MASHVSVIPSNSFKLETASTLSLHSPMPTRNVNLTDELDSFITAKVESGSYEDASEVIRAALRTMEQEDLEDQAKLSALQLAIDDGDASGLAEPGSFAHVQKILMDH